MKGFFVRVYAGLALVILVSIAIFTRMGTSEWPELASHMKRISGISAESLEERLEGADAPIGEDIRLSSELDLEIKLLPEGGGRLYSAKGGVRPSPPDHQPQSYATTRRLFTWPSQQSSSSQRCGYRPPLPPSTDAEPRF